MNIKLTNESFFICYGYPCEQDLNRLADYICERHNVDSWRPWILWLCAFEETCTPVDVLLAVWLSIHGGTPPPTKPEDPLSSDERARLVKILKCNGPNVVTLSTYEDLRKLHWSISWSSRDGLNAMVDNLAYLQEPMQRTIERIVSQNWEY